MANWTSTNIADVLNKIEDGQFVLPVIQRRLVWGEEKMALLFDTLLKGNAFGGIMALKEDQGARPLFASRAFTKDGQDVASTQNDAPLSQEQNFVIDGQQRLQTFYIGLTGSYNGKELYFNLNSDYHKLEFDFAFAADAKRLPPREKRDDGKFRNNIWYSAKSLYRRAKEIRNRRQLTGEVKEALNANGELVPEETLSVEANIEEFYESVFNRPSIGISRVHVNHSLDATDNKQRIVELFRRLNDGGTKLSAFDLVASILKGFDWEMEQLLEQTIKKYQGIGFGQDELIKLIFILQDDHRKEMASVTASDAKFATENRKRLLATLETVEKFLKIAKLHTYYASGNRSVIPLYFIAYHIFHQPISDDHLPNLFDQHDVNSQNYRALHRWVYISLLCGVFKSRGAGWIPYKTGIRKILEVVKKHRGKQFPMNAVFLEYGHHPLHFFTQKVVADHLDLYDASILYYMMYDCEEIIRQFDVDHIHADSILAQRQINFEPRNSVRNKQFIDYKTNRGAKNAKPFGEWIKTLPEEDRAGYLKRHLIPVDEHLWDAENFAEFSEKRAELIVEKINWIVDRQ